jgi:hypothetical protein
MSVVDNTVVSSNIKVSITLDMGQDIRITLGAENTEELFQSVETILKKAGIPSPFKSEVKESTPDDAVGVLVNKLLVYVETNDLNGVEYMSKALQRLLSVRN